MRNFVGDIDMEQNYPVPTMRIQPTITFEQFRETCGAVNAAKPKRVRQWSGKESLVLVVFGLVMGLAFQVPVARVPALTIFAIMILIWVLSKPLGKRWRERCLRDLYADEQSTLNGQVLNIDESGIAFERADGNMTSRLTWQAFTKRIDMPDAFVFISSPNHFVRVPKEMLSSSDIESILRWSSMVPTVGDR